MTSLSQPGFGHSSLRLAASALIYQLMYVITATITLISQKNDTGLNRKEPCIEQIWFSLATLVDFSLTQFNFALTVLSVLFSNDLA